MPRASKRERLIEGAIECLRTKGYARTTARDIAAAADANLASIGYHFGSKNGLLGAALLRVSEGWTEWLGAQALADDDTEPMHRIAVAFEAALQAFTSSPAARRLYASFIEAIADAAGTPELRAQLARHYDAMRGIVADLARAATATTAADRPAATDEDADALAALLIAVYDGYLIQALLDPERAPDPQRLVHALRTLSTAITGSVPAGSQSAGRTLDPRAGRARPRPPTC